MTILSIETSCDETAIAVLDINNLNDIKVRANVVSSQIALHAQYGGVVPNLAAREHAVNIGHVLDTALKAAGISDIGKEVDLIAVTRGPGLGPALLVGIAFAKTLAWKYAKPLVGASHMQGHLFSNWLNSNFEQPVFPVMNLIVSGGHTELVLMRDFNNFELVGETVDDAVGEAFDKVARLLDLGYPGGPIISKLAAEGNPDRFPLPSPMLHSKNYNFSYSGLKTAVLYLLRDLKEKNIDIDEQTKKDIVASFQKAAVDVLIQKTIRATKEYGATAIFLSGGVSANPTLRTELAKASIKAGFAYSQPPLIYTGDNAAMIAVAGYVDVKYGNAKTDWQGVDMDANLSF
jgi:N6-L-threonylcarbamoyladenine synthase